MINTRRGGPYPHLRVPIDIKATQGAAVLELVTAGATIREAATATGLSPSTAWRRMWFVRDWTLPAYYGIDSKRIPPMRGTRACPRGRPWIPELDGPGGPLDRRRYWK
ncbi:winged helix-turn-helix domain-containing protein [Streptomyces sp. NPDC054950]